MSSDSPTSPSNPPVTSSSLPSNEKLLEECNALILYVAQHGDVLGQNTATQKAYDDLVDAAENKDWSKLKKSYAKITAVTYANAGVNGRSVADTLEFGGNWAKDADEPSWRNLLTWPNSFFKGPRRPIAIGLLLFVAALVLQTSVGWAGRIGDPAAFTTSEVLQKFFYWRIHDLASLLLALCWGGIGSCIFLMKKLSDRLSEMSYEKARQKGDLARIFVGAFLGVATVELFFTDIDVALMTGDVNLTPNLVALAAGLSTKIVYGILESLIEGIAARISGSAGKGGQ